MSYLKHLLSPITIEALGKAFSERREITFPDLPRGTRWKKLVDAIGEDHAMACVKFAPGMTLVIPRQDIENARDETILDLARKGKSAKQISKYLFLTTYSERTIQRKINGIPSL